MVDAGDLVGHVVILQADELGDLAGRALHAVADTHVLMPLPMECTMVKPTMGLVWLSR